MKTLASLALFLAGSLWLQAQICARVAIGDAGPHKMALAKEMPGLEWWVELDDVMLVYGDTACMKAMAEMLPIETSENDVAVDRLAFVSLPLRAGRYRILAEGGRFAVIEEHPGRQYEPEQPHHDHYHHGIRLPFKPNTVLACRLTNRELPPTRAKRADVEALLAEINTTRWYFDIFDLQCKDRRTATPGIDDARDFLLERFIQMGLSPATGDFTVGGDPAQNVFAVLEGTERPDEYYIVGAHYDSIANGFAPGAEDNASGTAAVLEMARAFIKHPPPASIIFICFSGEEQGLFGSFAHVDQLQDQNLSDNVRGVLNMDMIGYTVGGFDVLLESASQWRDLVDAFAMAAQTYTSINVVTSFQPFGSDHVPYLNAGIPALLVIEDDWNRYPGYHRTNDTIGFIVPDMGKEVLRMNLAALAELMETPNP